MAAKEFSTVKKKDKAMLEGRPEMTGVKVKG
jgi:hypothetical protein